MQNSTIKSFVFKLVRNKPEVHMNFSDEMDSVKKSDRSLTPLLIQLEEVEEQIDGLQQSRLELIEKIVGQGGNLCVNDVASCTLNPAGAERLWHNSLR